MYDTKFEVRKNNFQKTGKSMLEARENFKLTLRKQRIEEFITKRRERDTPESDITNKRIYAIIPETLKIEEEVINKEFTSIEDYFITIRILISKDASQDLDSIKLGIFLLRSQLTKENKVSIIYLYNEGVFDILNNLLKCLIYEVEIVYEILWCFSIITLTYHPEILKLFCREQYLTNYINIFERYNEIASPIVDHLFWHLGNLVGDNLKARDTLVRAKLVDMVLILLNRDTSGTYLELTLRKTCIWFLSNSLKLKPQIEADLLKKCCQTILTHIFKVEDEELLNDAIWALSFASDTENQQIINLLVESDICKFIISSEKMTRANFILPCIRIIGNLLSCDSETEDYLLEIGCIPFLHKFLFNKYNTVRKQNLWAISNISAGNLRQIKTLLNSGIIPAILSMTRDADFEVVKEAIYLIGNIIKGGDYQCCIELVRMNFIDTLVYLLNEYKDNLCLVLTLDCLQCLFSAEYENCSDEFRQLFQNKGGADALEDLQKHKNDDVFNLVKLILEKFFCIELIK